MAEAVAERKLAAILHADVVGYSRLMGEDETGTHRLLRTYLDAITASITEHQGRVVNYAGDAVLADFTTVSNALQCAVAMQRDIKTRNAALPDARKVQFRIGINLGEVIVDREDIYGDGVNIAARLESLADPGGICLSESARSAVGNKLPLEYDDMGEQQVKNIAEPVRAYQARLKPGAELPRLVERPKPLGSSKAKPGQPLAAALLVILIVASGVLIWFKPWEPREEPASPGRTLVAVPSDKPAIAVLPFANMSADPEQEYFVDGMTEDLITDLSKVSGLLVIARNAVFAYKGQAVDIEKIAGDLGVRYVLEGSVRKAGGRVRINAQLIDTASVGHLWAERYDRELTDIFNLQDEVTAKIVAGLSVTLTAQEKRQLARRYTDKPEAYDYFLRGQFHYFRLTREDNARARELFRRAIELDPAFARAYGTLAMTHARDLENSWSPDRDVTLKRALERAHKAVALDNGLPQAHFVLSFVYLFRKQHDAAVEAAERALAADPNYADAYALLAWIYTYSDRAAEAVDLMARAMRLNPQPSGDYLSVLGGAYYWAGRYHEAVASLQKSLEIQHNMMDSHLYLAAAYRRLGQDDEAEWEVAEALALDPEFSYRRWADNAFPFQHPEQRKLLLDALREVGFPE